METDPNLTEIIEPTFAKERYRMLRRRVWLDLMNLDDELAQMSALLQDAAEYTAKAIEKQDNAEDFIEQMKAAVCFDLRSNQVNGKTRSEAQIATEYANDSGYQEAQRTFNSCRYDANLWKALTDNLRAKSHSINSAAELIKVGYITQTSIVGKRREELRKGPPK